MRSNNKALVATEFEQKFNKSEKKKQQMLENCRETFYFKKIFKIFIGLCFFGMMVTFFMPYLFQFVPIQR